MTTFDINRHHRAAPKRDPRIHQILPLVCADGFKMSVQASEFHYCEPRENHAWPYSQFEVGFPSRAEPLLQPFAQMTVDPDDSDLDVLSDVYPWVPAEVINRIVDAHGGLKEE